MREVKRGGLKSAHSGKTVRTPGKKGPGSRAPDETEDAQGGFGPGTKSVR